MILLQWNPSNKTRIVILKPTMGTVAQNIHMKFQRNVPMAIMSGWIIDGLIKQKLPVKSAV